MTCVRVNLQVCLCSEEARLVSEHRNCVAQLSRTVHLCVHAHHPACKSARRCVYLLPGAPEVRANCLDELRVVNETPL